MEKAVSADLRSQQILICTAELFAGVLAFSSQKNKRLIRRWTSIGSTEIAGCIAFVLVIFKGVVFYYTNLYIIIYEDIIVCWCWLSHCRSIDDIQFYKEKMS